MLSVFSARTAVVIAITQCSVFRTNGISFWSVRLYTTSVMHNASACTVIVCSVHFESETDLMTLLVGVDC